MVFAAIVQDIRHRAPKFAVPAPLHKKVTPAMINNNGYSNPLSPNLTDRDLSTMGTVAERVASSGGMNIGFYYERVKIKSRMATLNGKYETRLFVAMQPKGDKYSVAKEPISEVLAQQLFPAEYARFKNYQDAPTHGTPLLELPGISQSQIAILNLNGIRSIEDLVGLSPDIVAQVGMEASTAHKIALKWHQKRTGSSDDIAMAGKLSEVEAQNRQYQDTLKAMEARMAVMSAQLELIGRSGGMAAQPNAGAVAGVGGAVPESGVVVAAEPDFSNLPDMPFGSGVTDVREDPDPLSP